VARTDIHTAAGAPDRADQSAARIPLGRAADPREIAVAIAWLLGPEAAYVSGAILRVAGGM
jgi:NAD(P)-dependent dehydrogenase (short-subunit alcohol dehydrogenase family)